MDVTIYLPDETGKWAKEQNLPLSRMLRDAVDAERERQRALAATLEGATETHELSVTDRDGRAYTARLHAALIAESDDSGEGIFAYLGKDGLVYVYDGRNDGELFEDVDPDDLRDWFDDRPYIDAMTALGREAVIEVGEPG